MKTSINLRVYIDGVRVTDYVSFIWTDRYNQPGDFELVVPYTKSNDSLYKPYSRLTCNLSSHFMIVEEITYSISVENGKLMSIKGRSGESLLERRVIPDTFIVDNNTYTENKLMKALSDAFAVATSSNVKIMHNSNGYTPNQNCNIGDRGLGITFSENSYTGPNVKNSSVEFDATGQTLLDLFQNECQSRGFGFKVINGGLTVYNGTKTSLHYSEEKGNLSSVEITQSVTNFKNAAFIQGEEYTEHSNYISINGREYKTEDLENSEPSIGMVYTNSSLDPVPVYNKPSSSATQVSFVAVNGDVTICGLSDHWALISGTDNEWVDLNALEKKEKTYYAVVMNYTTDDDGSDPVYYRAMARVRESGDPLIEKNISGSSDRGENLNSKYCSRLQAEGYLELAKCKVSSTGSCEVMQDSVPTNSLGDIATISFSPVVEITDFETHNSIKEIYMQITEYTISHDENGITLYPTFEYYDENKWSDYDFSINGNGNPKDKDDPNNPIDDGSGSSSDNTKVRINWMFNGGKLSQDSAFDIAYGSTDYKPIWPSDVTSWQDDVTVMIGAYSYQKVGTWVKEPSFEPTLERNTFNGWYNGTHKFVRRNSDEYESDEINYADYISSASTVTYIANWHPDTYLITWDRGEHGTFYDEEFKYRKTKVDNCEYGSTPTPPTVIPNEGYSFSGWSPNICPLIADYVQNTNTAWESGKYYKLDSESGEFILVYVLDADEVFSVTYSNYYILQEPASQTYTAQWAEIDTNEDEGPETYDSEDIDSTLLDPEIATDYIDQDPTDTTDDGPTAGVTLSDSELDGTISDDTSKVYKNMVKADLGVFHFRSLGSAVDDGYSMRDKLEPLTVDGETYYYTTKMDSTYLQSQSYDSATGAYTYSKYDGGYKQADINYRFPKANNYTNWDDYDIAVQNFISTYNNYIFTEDPIYKDGSYLQFSGGSFEYPSLFLPKISDFLTQHNYDKYLNADGRTFDARLEFAYFCYIYNSINTPYNALFDKTTTRPTRMYRLTYYLGKMPWKSDADNQFVESECTWTLKGRNGEQVTAQAHWLDMGSLQHTEHPALAKPILGLSLKNANGVVLGLWYWEFGGSWAKTPEVSFTTIPIYYPWRAWTNIESASILRFFIPGVYGKKGTDGKIYKMWSRPNDWIANQTAYYVRKRVGWWVGFSAKAYDDQGSSINPTWSRIPAENDSAIPSYLKKMVVNNPYLYDYKSAAESVGSLASYDFDQILKYKLSAPTVNQTFYISRDIDYGTNEYKQNTIYSPYSEINKKHYPQEDSYYGEKSDKRLHAIGFDETYEISGFKFCPIPDARWNATEMLSKTDFDSENDFYKAFIAVGKNDFLSKDYSDIATEQKGLDPDGVGYKTIKAKFSYDSTTYNFDMTAGTVFGSGFDGYDSYELYHYNSSNKEIDETYARTDNKRSYIYDTEIPDPDIYSINPDYKISWTIGSTIGKSLDYCLKMSGQAASAWLGKVINPIANVIGKAKTQISLNANKYLPLGDTIDNIKYKWYYRNSPDGEWTYISDSAVIVREVETTVTYYKVETSQDIDGQTVTDTSEVTVVPDDLNSMTSDDAFSALSTALGTSDTETSSFIEAYSSGSQDESIQNMINSSGLSDTQIQSYISIYQNGSDESMDLSSLASSLNLSETDTSSLISQFESSDGEMDLSAISEKTGLSESKIKSLLKVYKKVKTKITDVESQAESDAKSN